MKLGNIADDRVESLTNRVNGKYGFQISRNEKVSSLGGLYIETYWTDREPFEDEKTLGYDRIQNQLVFTTKVLKSRTGSLSLESKYHEISVTIYQQGRKMYTDEYERFNFTTSGKEYAKDLAYALKDYVTGSLML